MMQQSFLFDVESVLLEEDGFMNDQFKKSFREWVKNNTNKHHIYLVTTEDEYMTRRHVGRDVFDNVTATFCSDGNAIYHKKELKWSHRWHLQDDVVDFLTEAVSKSLFTAKTEDHIQTRLGLVCFSVAGKNSDVAAYVKHDTTTHERTKLCSKFNEKFFGRYVARPHGKTNIIIAHHEHDRQRIGNLLKGSVNMNFFDNQRVSGSYNFELDKCLANVCTSGYNYISVRDWKQTMQRISEIAK